VRQRGDQLQPAPALVVVVGPTAARAGGSPPSSPPPPAGRGSAQPQLDRALAVHQRVGDQLRHEHRRRVHGPRRAVPTRPSRAGPAAHVASCSGSRPTCSSTVRERLSTSCGTRRSSSATSSSASSVDRRCSTGVGEALRGRAGRGQHPAQRVRSRRRCRCRATSTRPSVNSASTVPARAAPGVCRGASPTPRGALTSTSSRCTCPPDVRTTGGRWPGAGEQQVAAVRVEDRVHAGRDRRRRRRAR
jgi:hypothetical protein